MEWQRRCFDTFVQLHASKASTTSSPLVHAQFHSETMHPDVPLLLMTKEDVLEELDVESPLVRWLLKQLTTYDCTHQKLVVLIFDPQTVLSDVLWVRQ